MRTCPVTVALAGCLVMLASPLAAQISTAVIEQQQAALERQTTDPDQKRDGGTQPRDWEYQLGDGVRTRQVTFYVDGGVPLYGKLFFPKGFTATSKYAAVVVGHGINALSIGIEKFASRFAERGLVAMAIDYQSYGFSGSGSDDLRLLEPDPTTDAAAVTELERRLLLKRTNLNNVHEVADFRAAVSFLQGEPGVDPDRIGIWGSSNGGARRGRGRDRRTGQGRRGRRPNHGRPGRAAPVVQSLGGPASRPGAPGPRRSGPSDGGGRRGDERG